MARVAEDRAAPRQGQRQGQGDRMAARWSGSDGLAASVGSAAEETAAGGARSGGPGAPQRDQRRPGGARGGGPGDRVARRKRCGAPGVKDRRGSVAGAADRAARPGGAAVDRRRMTRTNRAARPTKRTKRLDGGEVEHVRRAGSVRRAGGRGIVAGSARGRGPGAAETRPMTTGWRAWRRAGRPDGAAGEVRCARTRTDAAARGVHDRRGPGGETERAMRRPTGWRGG